MSVTFFIDQRQNIDNRLAQKTSVITMIVEKSYAYCLKILFLKRNLHS